MPFREKSAWIMSFTLLLLGLGYFHAVGAIGSGPGELAAPMLPLVIAYTACLILLAMISHVAIAALTPREANAAPDERERRILERAGHYSAYVMGTGIVMSLGLYLLSGNGDVLFYTVFASLILGQIMEYVFQIVFYRTTL